MNRSGQLLTLLLVFVIGSCLYADDKDVALMLKAAGSVQIKKGRNNWFTAKRGQRLDSGELVRTGDNSLAALVFTDDKSQLKVRANSSVTINGKREPEGIIKRISLGFGELWAKVTKQNTSMRVETPSGVATVKGTEFNCLYINNNFIVYCREGLMEVFNQFGSMLLGADEMARLVQGAPPERIQGNPDEIFELGDDEGMELRIEFEDEDGNKKSLILDFN